MEQKEILKELEGQEVWTNAFGMRTCVGIINGKVIDCGQKIYANKQQIQQLWDDHIESEFGSKEQIMADLKEEFGTHKAKE